MSFYKVKSETRAIRITGCHDDSGSSDLKCVVYRLVGLSLSFVFASFVVIRAPFLFEGRAAGEEEGYGEGSGNYVTISFLKTVLFSLL